MILIGGQIIHGNGGKPKKEPFFKVGDEISGRRITKIAPSLGKLLHFYKTECIKCGTKRTLSEISLRQDRGCYNCFRQRVGIYYETVIPRHMRKKS